MIHNRKIGITQVSIADIGGGAERVARDLHTGCIKRGIRSRLAVGFRFSEPSDAIEIPNTAERSPWARTMLAISPEPPAPPARLSPGQVVARRALKIIAEPGRAWRRALGYEDFDYPGTSALPALGGAQPDILHLHNLHGGYFDLRRLPALSAQVPVVVTLHDQWLTTGHCAYSIDCARWRSGCGACPHLDSEPRVPRDRTAQNWAAKRDILSRSRLHVVGPSQWVLEQAADSILQAGTVAMHHIPNGVNQDVFSPAPDKRAVRAALGLPQDGLIVVFSAAVASSPYKDVATLVEALPLIAERTAPRPITLLSLGANAGTTAVPRAQVISVPYLSEPSAVARHLQAADLALHTARAENHPLAILEAQSCGLPVIASKVGGIPESLVDGETGLLVPPNDPVPLAALAAALLLDDSRREAMASAAASHAVRCFGTERMTDSYVALYHQILGLDDHGDAPTPAELL